MKKIVVVTATRAEYGLLKPIIIKLKNKELDVKVAVTGAHLSKAYGSTIDEIKADGIKIDKKIEILEESDEALDISKSMGRALVGFSEFFLIEKPDAILVLGDRYETLAVSIAAMNYRVPIIHLYGGETTEGAMDEYIRHSITKMSNLHFTSTEIYRKRVIQMGEQPANVYNVGAIGVENALKQKLLSKEEIENNLGIKLNKFAVGTYHPVTLEENYEKDIHEILDAIEIFKEYTFIFTKANADTGGRKINKILEDYSDKHSNFFLYDSLGMIRYLSLLRYADFVIGNSSSGIIEAPTFNIPTIDVGDRQKGRASGQTVLHCKPVKEDIILAIKKASTDEFKDSIRNSVNLYGDGNTSEKIVEIIYDYVTNNKLQLKKKFYDLEFDYD